MLFGLVSYFVYRRVVEGSAADRPGLGSRAGAAQAGARRRARQRPRPGPRHGQARRRHRLDRLPARRVESAPGPEPAAARAPLRDRPAADRSARRADPAGAARGGRAGACPGAWRSPTSTRGSRRESSYVARPQRRRGDRRARRASARSRRSSSAASRRRGSAVARVLGGVRGSKPAEVGPVTEYVLRHAPCRVLLTAPGGAERRAAADDGRCTAE